MKKIGVIGGGNMGSAIIKGVAQEYEVSVSEKDQRRASFLRRRFGVATLPLNMLAQKTNVIVIAVKPQDADNLLKELSVCVRPEQLIISIVAGLATSFIEKKLGEGMRVIRAMPNLPLQIGEGITAVCKGRHARNADVDMACKLFDHVGTTVIVKEALIDAVTAVSGSGPAYVFLIAECLIKAARRLGLNENLSKLLVQKTLTGSVSLLNKSKEEAGVLRSHVTSKGGTTKAALNVFERHQIEKTFKEALRAARDRARELAQR